MKLRNLAVAALTITGLAVGIASPASADNTEATFTLTGGDLTLSVQATATLTGDATGATAISGSLGAASVTDERSGVTAWNVTASSTQFTGSIGSSSTAVSYTAGVVSETGTITVADGGATVISGGAASVVSPASVSGDNAASWTPTLNVTMPADALAGTYTGTVTTSLT